MNFERVKGVALASVVLCALVAIFAIGYRVGVRSVDHTMPYNRDHGSLEMYYFSGHQELLRSVQGTVVPEQYQTVTYSDAGIWWHKLSPPDDDRQVLAVDDHGEPWIATYLHDDEQWAVKIPPKYGNINLQVNTSDNKWRLMPVPEIAEWMDLPERRYSP